MSSIEELESSIDIVELVKRYTALKKAWTNYKALCPFPGHNEKTPSFVVSPSKQLAHCFWCHRWWGPIKFIMDVENCEFREALEILSSITWVKLKWYDAKKEKIKKNIYSAYKDSVSYYRNNLEKYPDILAYLKSRWLTQESIDKFNLWYSDSWLELYNYLIWKWVEHTLIEKTWIYVDINSKKDKFLARVIFPIQNRRWDFVAMAWRVIWNAMPKYINSSASDIYDKSSTLYGLFQARNEITKKNAIIITEWYMDCIALHQAGFKNTVCVSGTALTEKHIWIIKKLTSRIYLCFDWDKAWADATNLSIEMLKNKDLEVKIINLWKYKDPDEAIKDDFDFENAIRTALTPIGYFLKDIKNTDSLLEKKEYLQKSLDILKNYQNNVEIDFYLKEISQILDIKLEVVYSEFKRTKLAKRENIWIKNNAWNITSQEMIIWIILQYPDYFEFIKENISFREFLNDDLQNILENWIEIINNFEINKKNKYKALSSQEEALEIQAQLEWSSVKNEEAIKSIILKTIKKLNWDILSEAKNELTEKIKSGDLEALKKYNELLKIKK